MTSIIRKMRLGILLPLLVFGMLPECLHAQNFYAENDSQVLRKSNHQDQAEMLESVPLRDVLKQLHQRYQWRFAYNDAIERLHVPENILQEKQEHIIPAISKLLKEHGFSLTVIGDRQYGIIRSSSQGAIGTIKKATKNDFQEQVKINGTIKDQSGNPLIGVTVKVVGKNQGTVTDANGDFSLEVEPDDLLEISFIGFGTQRVKVGNKTEINIILKPSNSSLNEVVVVGYGTQSKKDVTGAIGTINMKPVQNMPITAANDALVAQIPGVQVNATNGIPGGGPQVVIRNVGVIGADNSPLFVVDGFPLPDNNGQGARQMNNPLTTIPPEDIASITVLKDASATAIYGSRGANGVVIITTKSGEAGKLKFGLNLYNGWQVIPNFEKPDMMNAEEFAQFQKEIIEDNNAVNGTNTPIPAVYQNPSEYAGKGTNWYNAITREAPIQNVTLTMSGGTKNFTTFMSGGYLRQEGVVLGSNYNRVSLRVNVKGNIGRKWHAGLNVAPTYSFGNNDANGGLDRGDQYGTWEWTNPIPSIYNPDGSFNTMIGTVGTWSQPNPVMVLDQIVRKLTTTDIISSGFVSYDILPSLTLKSTINAELYNSDQNNFTPSTLGGTNAPPPSIASGSYSYTKFFNWANENSLTYQHLFPGGHSLTVVGDFSEQQEVYWSGGFNGSQFPDDAVHTLNAAGLITGGTNLTAWGLVSYLGRLNYAYKDKYLLTAAVRRDGSTKFGENQRWGTFPSVAAGWVITNEPWMKDRFSALSNLKVRASYGLVGNDEIGNFSYLSQLGVSNYILGNALSGGRTVNSIGNQDLAWEKTGEVNLGIDIGFFQNRLQFSGDVYKAKTDNLVESVNIPPSSGFSSITENIGSVQNKGIELSISSDNIVTKNFSWHTNINFTLARNKVLALGPNQTFFYAGTSDEGHPSNIVEIGKPVGMFVGYKVLGLYRSQKDIDTSAIFPGAIPGDLKVLDVNGDGKIAPVTDFTIIGNPYPKFQYGITSIMNYKSFGLNMVFAGSYGAMMYDAKLATIHNIDGIFPVLKDVMNRWRSESDPGNGWIPTTAGPSLGRVMFRDINSENILNASYFWCKNISLQYTLPEHITKKVFSDVTVYGSIQNAFVLTHYPGNPTGSNYRGENGNSVLTPGIDWNNYPTPRVFVIGVRVNY